MKGYYGEAIRYYRKPIINFLSFAATTCLLLFDALYNGYPLIYSDTGTYLSSGFLLETPFDRPITYGIFLRLSSLNGLSLWGTVVAQALLMAWLLGLTVRRFWDDAPWWAVPSVTAFLVFCTSLSWNICQLTPDIFTAVLILVTFLILDDRANVGLKRVLYGWFFVATCMHAGHFLFNLTFLALLFALYACFKSLRPLLRLRALGSLLVFSILSVAVMGSAFSKSSHVFLMGAMTEHGITEKYLDEYCPQRNYALCAYRSSFPMRAHEFVWESYSPVYAIGGFRETKKEFKTIINHTLREPKYLMLHIQASLWATFQQLNLYEVGEGYGPFTEAEEPFVYDRISAYFGHDLGAYNKSLQNQDKLLLFIIYRNYIIHVTMLLCLLGLGWLMAKNLRISPPVLLFAVLVLLGVLCNAWVCATFANAIDRLGAKVMWLLPLLLWVIWRTLVLPLQLLIHAPVQKP